MKKPNEMNATELLEHIRNLRRARLDLDVTLGIRTGAVSDVRMQIEAVSVDLRRAWEAMGELNEKATRPE